MTENKNQIPTCPVYTTLNIIGKKWTLLILRDLYCSDKSVRFNEIKRSIKGITPAILSKRLKEMEGDGIVQRSIMAINMPVKVEYSLTQKGDELRKIICDLKELGENWGVKEKEEILSCDLCKKRKSEPP
ncbi:MAG: helix-turn-helix domain-containing protein [Candidatus Altiarchaeota archaeon]|nr:helix-turn-helix domain-containing protein [Candidatus Altiarchaeota archaeon]